MVTRPYRIFIVMLGLGLLSGLAPPQIKLPAAMSLGPVFAPFGSIAALMMALIAVMAAVEPAPEIFATAPRSRHITNIVKAIIATLFGTLVLVFSIGQFSPVASSVLLYSGESFVSGAIGGTRVLWCLPAVHAMAAMIFGSINSREPAGWAWQLNANPNPGQLALSSAIWLLGLATWYRALSKA